MPDRLRTLREVEAVEAFEEVPMMRSACSVSALALLSWALLASVPQHAWAQSDADKATARDLGQSGQAALDAQDFAHAEDDFRRAEALYHAPTLVVGLARAQAAQGKVVEAWENYHRVILENATSSPAFAKALADAQAEIASAEARRARLTIFVPGIGAPRVTIDDVPIRAEALGIERLIDPGAHVVQATADGYAPAVQAVTLAEGGGQSVTLTLQKESPAIAAGSTEGATRGSLPSAPAGGGGSGMMIASWVSFGVGGAGLVGGVVAGILALSDHSTLKSKCTGPGGACPPSEDSALSSYHTVGALSTVGFVLAGVGVATGVTLLLVAPKNPPATPATGFRVSPYLGLGSVGAAGTF
jgi:hypothetical protein